jgi:hypothetical protein
MSDSPERDIPQEILDAVSEIKAGGGQRFQVPSPLQAVADVPEGDPLTLDEINEIVHKMRRKKQNPSDSED